MKPLILITLLITAPAVAQTMYKCPSPAGTVAFQQTPCDGGQAQAVKPITSGQGAGLSSEALQYLDSQAAQRAERNRLAEEESQRQEALNVERSKAAAQRETAQAIDRQTAIMAAPRTITIRRSR